jgi:hypothetical protein
MGMRPPIIVLPTVKELTRLFAYDPETGRLTWLALPDACRRIKVGDEAGSVSRGGYRIVIIGRRSFKVHRIVWKMMTGYDPTDQIDHADGDRANNRWSNLREATNGQNRHNTKLARNNRSGVKGVCWDGRRNVWVAYIGSGKKQTRLGRFKSFDEAVEVRQRAAAETHGEFARAA